MRIIVYIRHGKLAAAIHMQKADGRVIAVPDNGHVAQGAAHDRAQPRLDGAGMRNAQRCAVPHFAGNAAQRKYQPIRRLLKGTAARRRMRPRMLLPVAKILGIVLRDIAPGHVFPNSRGDLPKMDPDPYRNVPLPRDRFHRHDGAERIACINRINGRAGKTAAKHLALLIALGRHQRIRLRLRAAAGVSFRFAVADQIDACQRVCLLRCRGGVLRPCAPGRRFGLNRFCVLREV